MPAANDDWLSEADFQKWLDAAPANQQLLADVMAEVAAGKHGEVRGDVRAAAKRVLMKRHEQRCMGVINGKLTELRAAMRRPAGTLLADERLQRCRQLVDEISDNLLDMPEPLRTEFFKLFQPTRDKIRALG